MESMFSKMSARAQATHDFLSNSYQGMSPKYKTVIRCAAMGAVMMTPQLAFAADDGTAFFCIIAKYFKGIVGGAALVALLMWAIEHIFGVAKLHDVVMKVGIAALIVISATTLIAKSGLAPPGCEVGLTL
jgi:hypothetical protein